MKEKNRIFSKCGKYFQGALTLVLLAAIVLTNFYFLPRPGEVQAATYYWTQTDWSGGTTTSAFPNHTNQVVSGTPWTKYYSASSSLNIGTSITLATTSGSWTDNTFATSSGGGTASTTVSSSTVILTQSSSRPAAPANSGTNNAGADLTPANGSTISGSYYNVGTFTITSGYTVYIPSGSVLQIKANTINIAGTLNGDAKGYAGGAGGSGALLPSGPPGQSGTYKGSYGTAGGPGGVGTSYPGDPYCDAATGGNGGTSAGVAGVDVRGTLNGTDIDMGGGAGGGGQAGVSVGGCGGGDQGGSGGNGGGGIYLYASSSVTATGKITVNGGGGGNGGCASCLAAGGGGAGGAGGGILINGSSVTISGTSTANGGTGGAYGSGGFGGAGRIKLFGNITNTNANFSATGSNATTTQCSNTSSLCNVGTIYSQSPTYAATGTFTSQIKNIASQSQRWATTTWTDTLPASTSIALKVRSCDDASCSASGGVDESVTKPWSSCGYIAKGAALSTGACVTNGDQYIQYQATASTTDTTVTPTLSAVTINYNYYPSYQLLTSSPYDTGSSANILSGIKWSESLATNTDILFQVRTAATSTGPWTSWQGPDGTSNSYFTDPLGASTTASALRDGSNDQWIQYQLTASSTGQYTPSATSVTMVYVVNSPPQFQSAPTVNFSTSTQLAQVSYSVLDPDTDSGSPSNQYRVWPSFEYSTSAGASWTAVSTSTLLAADYATQTVATNTYNTHTATWDAQKQLGFQTNTTTARIKVTVDDHEAANNTAFSSSTNFTLDTRPLSNINASQTQSEATAGKVNVGFDYFVSQGVRASSTLSLKYYNGASWLNATSVTGDTGQGVASGTAKQIVWNAKADYPGIYTNSMKVRVVAVYNGTSQELESSNFILDTKNPASSLTFDAGVAGSTSSAVITITPSDDSSSSYKISDDPTNQTGTTTTGWVSINSTSTINWTFDSDIEAKSLKVQYRDVYFNTTTEATITTLPPITPTSFLIQDVSKTATQEWRLYAGWGVSTSSNFASYKLEYATSTDNSLYSGYSNAAVITSSSTNYYVHTGLNTNWYYRYRIGVTDTNGNTSVRSNGYMLNITAKPDGVQNFGEGGGGSVATASKVENVTASQGSDKNVTVNYLLTDSSTSTKTNLSYEGYLFYNLGITLPANASSSGNLTLSDTSKLVSTGYIQINNEVLQYTGNSTSTNTLTGITRGTWPNYASSGRTTRQNNVFWQGTPVWVLAASTTPITVTNSTISTGQAGTITWNTVKETTLAGNTFSNLPIRVLVHDNQLAASGPLSTQNDYSTDGTLSSLDLSPPNISFASASSSGSETTATTSFALNLSKPYALNVSVNYSATGGTASGNGVNYTLNPGTTTIPAGATTTNITGLTIVNNLQPGPNTTVIISLSNPQNATLGVNTTYTYTIINTNSQTVQFAAASSSALEASTTVNIPLVLAGVSNQNVAINFSVASSSTAQSGISYNLATTSATITAGATSTNISLNIYDDGVYDSPDKFVILNLNSSQGANLGTTTQHTLTILDNDRAYPEFSATSTSVSQVASSTDPNFGKVKIQYSVRDINTTSNLITPSFEYNVGFGWNNIASTSLSAGDLNPKAVATSTFNTYTAYWDAGSQVFGAYTASAQVRITANNGATRNNTASTTSTFLLDAKNPVVSFSINGSQNIITLTATEDNNFNYVISNNSYLTADGSNGISGNWQPGSAPSLTASTTWVFASATYPTVYYRVRDIYNNAISTSTARAPSQPANFTLRDVSNVQMGQYREFLAWDPYVATTSAAFSRYELYRSTDAGANYSLLASTTQVSTNSYTDINLSTSTAYYYKVRTVDTDNDTSAYSSEVHDVPDGQGGTDVTPPAISSTTAAEVQSSWAKITWTTDELSTSLVEYGLTNTNYNMSASSTAYVLNHEIALSGLTSGFSTGTTYYFRVKSSDISGNQGISDNSGLGYSFTTAVGPAISGVATESVDDRSAVITWNTNIAANSYVIWATSTTALATNASGTVFQTGSPTLVTDSPYYQHKVTLSGLTAGRTYYYYVQSTDGSNNTITDKNVKNNVVSYYYFNTTYDTKPPVISNIQTPVRTAASIVITWQTDELADGRIQYGTSTGNYSSSTALDTTLSIYHIATIAGLSSETTYYYRVTSADAQTNSTSSPEQTVQTTSPLQTVTVMVVSGGGGGAAGVAQDLYDKIKSDYDKLNKEYWDMSKEYEKFKDTTPPVLSNIQVSGIEAFQATVTWQTDEPADAFVDYGETTDYNFNTGSSDLTKDHKITLKRLKMGTTYHFKASSQDKLSNLASSTDSTFTTLFAAEALDQLVKVGDVEQFQQKLGEFMESVTPSLVPPVISDVKAEDITENSANITWRTNVKSSSIVALAQEEEYKPGTTTPYTIELGNSQERETSHKVQLTNLIPDTLYNFQVKSQNAVGAVGASRNFTFTTRSLPVKPRVLDITKNSMQVVWKTEKQASSIVEYKNLTTGETLRKVDEQKAADHFVSLENLSPDTAYELKVSGADERGNLIESGALKTRTSKDIIPPVISSIKIDSTLIPGRTDRVQTIVRWLTNEPANSVVYYEEGSGGGDTLANKIEAMDVFVQEHAIIVPVMKPGTLYRVKIASSDEAKNEAQTPARTIITPQYAQSIIDVVVKNFQDTFKFLDKLK